MELAGPAESVGLVVVVAAAAPAREARAAKAEPGLAAPAASL